MENIIFLETAKLLKALMAVSAINGVKVQKDLNVAFRKEGCSYKAKVVTYEVGTMTVNGFSPSGYGTGIKCTMFGNRTMRIAELRDLLSA